MYLLSINNIKQHISTEEPYPLQVEFCEHKVDSHKHPCKSHPANQFFCPGHGQLVQEPKIVNKIKHCTFEWTTTSLKNAML